ncbi:HAMP domain-containing sensor histidine kinase [Porphyromonas sp. COT-239 OH1446]|uniref:sensor histidine kinase n=1 Tax=Porphyromonas sp. COT-239 OH1446 TaxID=1515613 RepID=UPI001F3B84E9|nr:HAMP domain-containing sensor histidine kinase [Porphyromonas sp. COT-239 OH1446]
MALVTSSFTCLMASKLIHRTVSRLAVALSVILTLWAVLFYFAIIGEVTDEIDDSLEDYSEQIIIQALAGEDLPRETLHSNNQYYLKSITVDEARSQEHIRYLDSMVYIPQKREQEPARVMQTIYRGSDGYYQLSVFTPTIERLDLISSILLWIIGLYGLLLLVILSVSSWVYHRSNRPLYRLLRWLDLYNIDGNNPPLEINTDIVEYRKLHEATLRSTKRSEEVYRLQKQFIGDASHEIQTPVAICMNRIELLMQDERLLPEQLSELDKAHQSLEYLSRLNRALLLLYRIDNEQFTDRTPVQMNELIRSSLRDLELLYEHLYLEVRLIERGECVLRMDPQLAQILVNNLLKNAFVHNRPHGPIEVEIWAHGFFIRNASASEALDAELIFSRFYQAHRKPGSVGLGLALVHSICSREGLVVRYRYAGGLHGFEVSSKKESQE